MTIRTTILILTALFCSCQNKTDNINATTADKVSKSDLLDLLDKVPKADKHYYFNTINDDFDTKELTFLPDSVIDKMAYEATINTELRQRQELKNIRQFRDAYKSTESIQVGFYRLLPVDSKTYNVLTAFVIGGQRIEWQILTFDKKAREISAIDRIHEVYTSADTVFGLWWYASNEYPHFETWIKNDDGEFEMILQSEDTPDQLKERLKSEEK